MIDDEEQKQLPPLPDPATLSETQKKVLRILARTPNMYEQLSGNGMAPIIAGAKALVRKGVLGTGGSSKYYVRDHARGLATSVLEAWKAERAAEKAAAAAKAEAAHAT